ncbi:Non-structural protein NSP1 like [uncultured Mediterranean phage uvMED]|nr:Non-structural protein NSP1 like [uncultured Mediterranean phage uvMED]
MAEENIQGAAEKISGLLNPKQDNQVPETNTEPSESTPETQEVQESTESKEAPIEQASENTETTEETPTELETPELHRVKVQGQELEVSLDELKAGYSRDSDYRQKTHSLGMEKRDLETQKNSLRQTYDTRLSELNDLISTANQFVEQKQGGQDLAKLYQEDPTEAAKLDFQLRQEKQHIESLKATAREAQTKQYESYLETQKELAATKIPEFSDPNKADSFKLNMRNSLRSYGFNDQEIGSLADHRFLMVAKDAMSFQSQKDKRPIVSKKVANAPKVLKAGVAKSNVSSGREEVRNKIKTLRKTGHIRDAQSAIADMINLKSQQRK